MFSRAEQILTSLLLEREPAHFEFVSQKIYKHQFPDECQYSQGSLSGQQVRVRLQS